ncbi:MAG TPA: nuclear transport factor 2 family protein [Mariprofundaceae bacterium]|nr:nuclear transport factor 2 family protein [Mariprofundaceae bacterium]
MRRLLIILFVVALAGCSGVQTTEINEILNARDQAISNKDVGAYSALLLNDYMDDHGKSKITVVAQFVRMFEQFDKTEMHSFDRDIRLIDDAHAECEQSYKLRVRADGRWRELVQREQLYFVKTKAGWRISGGL